MKWKKVGGGDFWERKIFLFCLRFREEGLNDFWTNFAVDFYGPQLNWACTVDLEPSTLGQIASK